MSFCSKMRLNEAAKVSGCAHVFIAAVICLDNALPMRRKLPTCTICPIWTNRTQVFLQLFDSPGMRFYWPSADIPPIVGPSIGGHAIYLYTPGQQPLSQARFNNPDPVWQATGKWMAQFGRNLNGHLLGFRWQIGPSFQWPMNMGPILKRGDVVDVVLPSWFLMLVFAPLPLMRWFVPRFRRLVNPPRDSSIYCDICGYDLRATSNFCPECGTTRAVSTAIPPRGVEPLYAD
jgi:hypothetical protein